MENDKRYTGRQWRERLEMWSKWFPAHRYEQIKEIPIKGFVTRERLPFCKALLNFQEKVSRIKPGDRWGHFWEYGWFIAEWTVPEELEGQRELFLCRVSENAYLG